MPASAVCTPSDAARGTKTLGVGGGNVHTRVHAGTTESGTRLLSGCCTAGTPGSSEHALEVVVNGPEACCIDHPAVDGYTGLAAGYS